MSDSIGIVILAAGKGTRMKTDTPKALMKTVGRPLLSYVLDEAFKFIASSSLKAEVGIVVGHKKNLIEDWLRSSSFSKSTKTAWQKEQNGTADALKACFYDLPHFWDFDYTLIACADTPLIKESEFHTLFSNLKSNDELVGVAATFETGNPKGYGRIIHGGNGFHIVEEKDATDEEKKITEVNSGFYILKTRHLRDVLASIDNNNKSGEFYLTDLFQDRFNVKAVKFFSETPFLGINTMEQLAEVTKLLSERKLKELMLNGVEFYNPNSVYIDYDVTIGAGSVIYPNVTLLGQTIIGEKVLIESGVFIKNSSVHTNSQVLANSYLEEAIVHERGIIGPMARLRPGSDIGPDAKIGNFVEVKKSKLAKGVKVSHLSYVGDAEIGENTNIGCGFITCNFDGVNKHKTKIGSNSFIGSDCQTIAPLEIGNDAFIAAGSTITQNIPDGGFGIARPQFVLKEGAARRFLKSKKS